MVDTKLFYGYSFVAPLNQYGETEGILNNRSMLDITFSTLYLYDSSLYELYLALFNFS